MDSFFPYQIDWFFEMKVWARMSVGLRSLADRMESAAFWRNRSWFFRLTWGAFLTVTFFLLGSLSLVCSNFNTTEISLRQYGMLWEFIP